jgi:hypothetical protein
MARGVMVPGDPTRPIACTCIWKGSRQAECGWRLVERRTSVGTSGRAQAAPPPQLPHWAAHRNSNRPRPMAIVTSSHRSRCLSSAELGRAACSSHPVPGRLRQAHQWLCTCCFHAAAAARDGVLKLLVYPTRNITTASQRPPSVRC